MKPFETSVKRFEKPCAGVEQKNGLRLDLHKKAFIDILEDEKNEKAIRIRKVASKIVELISTAPPA